MLQYFIAEQTDIYSYIYLFKYLYFPSTIADTSHIPSTITLAKYLSSQFAEAFKPHDIDTYIFSITPSLPMGNQDQLKYRLGSVNIGLDWLGLVNIGLDWLILVWIG